MYTMEEYDYLENKYGSCASWAVWNHKDEKDTSIISQQISQLHSKFVLVGLNIARPLENESWLNFHGGSIHDRKIKYACNDNKLRGSYITDLFKGIVEVNSSKFMKNLTDKMIRDNTDYFNQEMRDIKISEKSEFIIFGTPRSILAQCFQNYFSQNYNNRVTYHYHYAYYRITDKKWTEGLWNKLDIQQNFELTVNKYR